MKKFSLIYSDIMMEARPVDGHFLKALGVYSPYRRLPQESPSHVALRIGKKSTSEAMVRGLRTPRSRARLETSK